MLSLMSPLNSPSMIKPEAILKDSRITQVRNIAHAICRIIDLRTNMPLASGVCMTIEDDIILSKYPQLNDYHRKVLITTFHTFCTSTQKDHICTEACTEQIKIGSSSFGLCEFNFSDEYSLCHQVRPDPKIYFECDPLEDWAVFGLKSNSNVSLSSSIESGLPPIQRLISLISFQGELEDNMSIEIWGHPQGDYLSKASGKITWIPWKDNGIDSMIEVESSSTSTSDMDSALLLQQKAYYSAFRYSVSTDRGSSGSPIIHPETNTIIGIHRGESNVGNCGIPISNIFKWISKKVEEDPINSIIESEAVGNSSTKTIIGENTKDYTILLENYHFSYQNLKLSSSSDEIKSPQAILADDDSFMYVEPARYVCPSHSFTYYLAPHDVSNTNFLLSTNERVNGEWVQLDFQQKLIAFKKIYCFFNVKNKSYSPAGALYFLGSKDEKNWDYLSHIKTNKESCGWISREIHSQEKRVFYKYLRIIFTALFTPTSQEKKKLALNEIYVDCWTSMDAPSIENANTEKESKKREEEVEIEGKERDAKGQNKLPDIEKTKQQTEKYDQSKALTEKPNQNQIKKDQKPVDKDTENQKTVNKPKVQNGNKQAARGKQIWSKTGKSLRGVGSFVLEAFLEGVEEALDEELNKKK